MTAPPPKPPDAGDVYRPRLSLYGTPSLASAQGLQLFTAERRFQMLVLLALSDGQWVPRDRIAGLLWPERPDVQARRNLRTVIFRLRGIPGLDALEVADHGLRWPVDSDVDATVGDGVNDAAVDAGAGQPLAGLDDPGNPAWSEWLATQRQRLAQSWRQRALAALSALADPAARVALAGRMLQWDPLDEDAVEALMRAERERSDGHQALRHFERYAVRLADELGVQPPRRLRELATAVAGAGRATPARVADAAEPTVPAGGGFVGRRQELRELSAGLADPEIRWLSLTGPGGIGKSRLAREALPALAAGFPDGVHWIELQDLQEPAQVRARLAQRLELDINDARDPVAAIVGGLAARRVLLVFDNAEHLPQLHELFERLLAGAPGVKLLVTTRSRSVRSAERVLPLGGLHCPDDDSRDLEAAATFDAVRLFEQRARAARSGFALAPHLPAVIAVVDAVGGMPLAIELAASWVRLLPVEEMARDLLGSLDLFERDPAAAEAAARPEHASLRAVVDRSVALLAPREREALSRLSVFVGRFTRAAAREVADASLPLLSSLADGSLLEVDAEGRFALHPVISAYAAGLLGQDPSLEQRTRQRHAEHHARALQALAPHVRTDMGALLRGLEAVYADTRAAWLWAIGAGRADLVDAMAPALWRLHENTGRFVEGAALLAPALALPERGPTAVRALARVRVGLGVIDVMIGRLEDGRALSEAVIAAGEGCGDLEAYVGSLGTVGSCLWHQGHYAQALAYDERALEVSRRHQDKHCLTLALGKIALSRSALGDPEQAIRDMTEAIAITRETGNRNFRAAIMTNLGGLQLRCGRTVEARGLLEAALQEAQACGMRALALFARQNLGIALLRSGDAGAARTHLAQVLERAQAQAMTGLTLGCLRDLARVEIAERRFGPALAHLQSMLPASAAQAAGVHRLRALATYGEWLAAQGRASPAAQVWHAVLGDDRLDSAERAHITASLAALPAAGARPDATAAASSSLDDWARQVMAQPAPPA